MSNIVSRTTRRTHFNIHVTEQGRSFVLRESGSEIRVGGRDPHRMRVASRR